MTTSAHKLKHFIRCRILFDDSSEINLLMCYRQVHLGFGFKIPKPANFFLFFLSSLPLFFFPFSLYTFEIGRTDWISSFWISNRAVNFLLESSTISSLKGLCEPLWWCCLPFGVFNPSNTYLALHTILPPLHKSSPFSTTSNSQENISSALKIIKMF